MKREPKAVKALVVKHSPKGGRHRAEDRCTPLDNRDPQTPLASRLRIPRWLGGSGS